MIDRNAQGRFTPGNQLAALGWAGLVSRRFAGDQAAARAWVGQLGRWAYGLNYRRSDGQYQPWVKAPFRQHPGQPEQFVRQYRAALEFTLADVTELRF